jgi:hypothetical protein
MAPPETPKTRQKTTGEISSPELLGQSWCGDEERYGGTDGGTRTKQRTSREGKKYAREQAALKRFLLLPVAYGVAQAGDRRYVEKSLKGRLVFTARTSNCRCAVLVLPRLRRGLVCMRARAGRSI